MTAEANQPDRVMVITGTSRGLGRAMAEHFLARGWIVAGCSRAGEGIDHPSYDHHQLDVSDEQAVVAMVRSIQRRHGRIDALINNAGIASMNPVLLTPLATVNRILATNVAGTFLFCREVGKVMARLKHGRIVNLTTVARPWRLEGESAYAASKAAVESLTEVLARELGPAGVTVNAVGPTPVPTDLLRGVPEASIEALRARQSIPRMGTPDDVIHAVEFFLDKRSDFVTGQILYLGGVNG